ncbi:MAG: precorrin-6A reductase [Peptostreptococcaceae bacterium]
MILVLGGTSDSLELCSELKKIFNLKYTLSVTTEYGKELAKGYARNIILGKLDKDNMMKFIEENKISQIIDATHPYATEVSKNAIECAKEAKIDYIRYERKSLIDTITYENVYVVNTIEEACKIACQRGHNIFIGTGSKNLEKYVELIPNKTLVARVLPTSEVVRSCEQLGFNGDNLIAMKGPFSQTINMEMYKQYKIDLVITKESGVVGGFLEKVEAAELLDIPVVIIKRETMNYPKVINDVKEVRNLLEF